MTQPVSLEQIAASANYAAGAAREALALAQKNAAADAAMLRQMAELVSNSTKLAQTVAQMSAQRTGGNPSLQYVENIPGRRVPFDQLVSIPIGADLTSETQGSITINQDGPFVAVSRMAIFLSQFSFQFTDPETGTPTIFNGRSYGRWRPVHSAWDLYDGVPRSEVMQAVAAPGAGAPHIISPSNASSWRSMQPDFSIELRNDGTAYPRSNLYVPSPFWTKQINSPFNLGALDVFERGEVITFRVQPQHPNNPAFGDIQAFTGPGTVWPFLQSQFDAVEGINDAIIADVETDPVTRLPSGFLIIGLHGYKIIQPPGAGPY
jgi:hypothetical protein